MAVETQALVARPRTILDVIADYVGLLKPRIVLLLVLTEAAAMVTAAHGLPRVNVLLGASVGGGLAAGGSGAINCWFDRDIDAIMPRTRRRAVPSGRVGPTAALAFGACTALVGVLLITLSTNALAGLLSAVGGLVYVLVYTMWLKRSTAQNIVIGGAAGAVPPLVGWAAVTGSLSPVAWAFFLIVFFWTPPHFWALAVLLRGQYSAVRVPMLPSVSTPEETNRAIVAYTLIMLAVSLSPAIWLGPGYAVPAAGLGAGFLALALRASRRADGRSARLLFSYSLIYLAGLFLAAALSASLPR